MDYSEPAPMTTEEKLTVIKRWTDEFIIRSLRNSNMVVCGTKMNKWSTPYDVTFANEKDCINVRYNMIYEQVYDICQYISEIENNNGSPDTVGQ